MSLRIEFLAGADADLQTIFERFEDYQVGFGVEFLTMLDSYLARLAIFPESAPVYVEQVRRQVMRTFPYGIFYEPQASRILIAAILDLRQDEAEIFRRLRPTGP